MLKDASAVAIALICVPPNDEAERRADETCAKEKS
jgi:hypothetical protein